MECTVTTDNPSTSESINSIEVQDGQEKSEPAATKVPPVSNTKGKKDPKDPNEVTVENVFKSLGIIRNIYFTMKLCASKSAKLNFLHGFCFQTKIINLLIVY